MVKVPCFHCREHGFNPWSGNLRSHMPCDIAKKNVVLFFTTMPYSTSLLCCCEWIRWAQTHDSFQRSRIVLLIKGEERNVHMWMEIWGIRGCSAFLLISCLLSTVPTTVCSQASGMWCQGHSGYFLTQLPASGCLSISPTTSYPCSSRTDFP